MTGSFRARGSAVTRSRGYEVARWVPCKVAKLPDRETPQPRDCVTAPILARMKKLLVLLLAVASACASVSSSQPPAAQPGSDQFAIESTVLAVYNVISGPAGRRDWDRFEALFAPGARMISTHRKDGVVTANVMTPKEYETKAGAYFADHGFFERPAANRLQRFGDIAQVFSTYESRHASSDDKPFARGINSFQLVRIGDDWKVLTIFWEEEDAAHPIPAEYLQSR